MIVHIGRKVPKGFRELPGGIHLGKGIWMLKMEKIPSVSANNSNISMMAEEYDEPRKDT